MLSQIDKIISVKYDLTGNQFFLKYRFGILYVYFQNMVSKVDLLLFKMSTVIEKIV